LLIVIAAFLSAVIKIPDHVSSPPANVNQVYCLPNIGHSIHRIVGILHEHHFY
jgi:hypothetical protein